MKRRRLWLAVALTAGLAIAVAVAVAMRPDRSPAAVYEAVFVYVAHRNYGRSIGKGTFYLSIEGRDPSPTLLQRLNTEGLTVRPWSEGVKSHSRGVWIPLSRLRRTGARTAEVEWSYYHGPMMAAGFRCTVVWRHGKWRVEKEQRLWIS
ncbi:MAG: hypothetical protein ACE149_19530 [Armatimonadota bacterium]